MLVAGHGEGAATAEPAVYGTFDCHAWSQGPYGGVGGFLRRIVAELPTARRALIEAHEVELCSAVPDLRGAVPDLRGAPAAVRAGDVRIRFHPAKRTRALAFGLAGFVAGWAAGLPAPVVVQFGNVDQADATTLEFLDALRRAGPPGLVVETGPGAEMETAEPEWHDRRADELEATGEWSWRLGAIPYHRERGTAPETAGVAALFAALDHCVAAGFYTHGQRLAERGLRLVSPAAGAANRWAFTTGLGTCETALGRPAEALERYRQAWNATPDPKIRMSAAASIATLHARHLPGDPAAARPWVEEALALAGRIEEPRRRTVLTVFYGQIAALVDHRTGDRAAALRTVEEGLARLERDLAPGERRQDRARLLHNRAQLHLAAGRAGAALADLDAVIAEDPDNAEYYVDRGALHRAAGRPAAAVADYGTAIRLGPHLAEAYYNRALTARSLGDLAGARADLDRVLAQDPGHADALLNRSGLRYESGDPDGAEADARAGLSVRPDDPELLCALGLARAGRGAAEEAEALLTRAVEARPDLTEALINRAAIRYERGAVAAAIADLDRAIAVADGVIARYNRGHAHQELAHWPEAAADFAAALALDDGADPELTADLRARLAQCRQ
ncbi:tetratricopeptide repeat protein [Dactylosporangium sp. CA-092794]|uniref:tetratricopeptide repeat protein n=1 Tax=Dactylosporangium sp. CA-092794 TaxID=3239929 RepID=UPI003D940259